MNARRPPAGRLRLIGVAGILVIAALVYLVFAGRLPGTPTFRIEAVVASTNELKSGSPVRIAGVEVGEVAAMRSGPGDAATLVLELRDAGRPLHTDASLKIRPRLFLEGGFYVDLRAGSPSAPALRDGGRIPLSRTAIPVQFSQILTTFTADLRTAFQTTLREVADGLDGGGARALGRAARPAGDVARDAAIIARAARGDGRRDSTDIVQGAARIAGALADRRRELAGLVTDLRRTTDVLADRDDQLAATMVGLNETLEVTPAALRGVDALLPDVRRAVRTARPSLRRLPGILTDADLTLAQAAALVSAAELPRLLATTGPAVRRLPTLVRRLQVLLPLVTPVTDCLRDRALPVLFGKVQDGAHSTGQQIFLELLHSATGVAGSLQAIDGNGMQGRVLASGGEQSLVTSAVPGTGPLLGRVASGEIGSRPVPLGPGKRPSYRPDAECRRQAPVDLTARTGPVAVPVRADRGRGRQASRAAIRRLLAQPRLSREPGR